MSNSLDVTKLYPKDLQSALKLILFSTSRAAFVWGPPGVGKSAIAQFLATERGIAFIDVRLSQMEPTDLRGIPHGTVIAGQSGVEWSTPYIMPVDLDYSYVAQIEATESKIRFLNPRGANGIHYCTNPSLSAKPINPEHTAEILSKGLDTLVVVLRDSSGRPVEGKVRLDIVGKVHAILALEEMNSAAPSVQAAAYELIQDRRLGEYIVPEGVKMVAMGNRETDKGVTYRMATPLANRFIHFELDINYDEWSEWAIESGIHRDVVGYLSKFKDDLFDFKPGSASRGFATPRSWHMVSDALYGSEKEPVRSGVLHAVIVGAIGDGIAIKLKTFRESTRNLPDPDKILDGSITELKDKATNDKIEPGLQYALVTTLCYRLREENTKMVRDHGEDYKKHKDFATFTERMDNFLSFMLRNMVADMSIMGFKTAIQLYKLQADTKNMKSYKEFVSRFKDFILG